MSDQPIIFPGTTPAGKAPREIRLRGDGDGLVLSIWSASGNFMADIRINVDTAQLLGEVIGGWAEAQFNREFDAAMAELVAEGMVIEKTTDDGEIAYKLTEKGLKRAEEIVQQITTARGGQGT